MNKQAFIYNHVATDTKKKEKKTGKKNWCSQVYLL